MPFIKELALHLLEEIWKVLEEVNKEKKTFGHVKGLRFPDSDYWRLRIGCPVLCVTLICRDQLLGDLADECTNSVGDPERSNLHVT